jgi:hypothetical protein
VVALIRYKSGQNLLRRVKRNRAIMCGPKTAPDGFAAPPACTNHAPVAADKSGGNFGKKLRARQWEAKTVHSIADFTHSRQGPLPAFSV